MSDEKKDASKACSTCGKVENPVCSNSFHLPAYQSALQAQTDTSARWKFDALLDELKTLANRTDIDAWKAEVRDYVVNLNGDRNHWKCVAEEQERAIARQATAIASLRARPGDSKDG